MRGLSFKNKAKERVCRKCKFDYICGGVWKEYAENNGYSELYPILVKKINDPVCFTNL